MLECGPAGAHAGQIIRGPFALADDWCHPGPSPCYAVPLFCSCSALEAAGKWYGATEAGPALPAAVTSSQFAGCMMLPAVIESVSHKGGGMAAMRAIPFREWRMLKLYGLLFPALSW